MLKIMNLATAAPLGKLPALHGAFQVLRAVPERNELIVKGRFNNELMRAQPEVIGLSINPKPVEDEVAYYDRVLEATPEGDPARAMLQHMRDLAKADA